MLGAGCAAHAINVKHDKAIRDKYFIGSILTNFLKPYFKYGAFKGRFCNFLKNKFCELVCDRVPRLEFLDVSLIYRVFFYYKFLVLKHNNFADTGERVPINSLRFLHVGTRA